MAKKTVQPVILELDIRGKEKLVQLNNSFKELGKRIKLSDRELVNAARDVKNFSDATQGSENTIKGQIRALQSLREQAVIGSRGYRAINAQIDKFKFDLIGSTNAIEKKRESLVGLATQSKNNAAALAKVVAGLQRLRSSVREDSAAYRQLNGDIEKTNKSLKEINVTAAKAKFTVNQALAVKPEKIILQIKRIQAAIASGTLEAQDLARALLDLELLNVGAGRAGAARKAQAFDDRIGKRYFDSLRKNYEDLAKTSAIISQRISEVNTELANVTGYERRRALTIELINLNKELRNAVVNARTAEEFQGLAIRQRMGRARESYAESGFGAFSADIRQRTAAGEFTPGMQKSLERVRLAKQEAQEMEQIAELQKVINDLADEHVESLRSAARTMDEYGQKLGDDIVRKYEEATAAQQKAAEEEEARSADYFKRELERTNILFQARKAAASALGIGGIDKEDISSLYEGIIGLSTADIRRQQEMMGKSAKEVFNDIVTAFEKGGRAVDLKSKSTSIGDDIAEGVVDGASDSGEIDKGAKTFAQRLIAAYKAALRIKSPSGESRDKIGVPVGQGIVEGAISAIDKAKFADAIQKALVIDLKNKVRSQIKAEIEAAFRATSRMLSPGKEDRSSGLGFATENVLRMRDIARQPSESDRLLAAGGYQFQQLTGQEYVIQDFLNSLRAATVVFNAYFNANSVLPAATRKLAAAMNRAAQVLALPASVQPFAALPSSEMIGRQRMSESAAKAAQIDAQNVIAARLRSSGLTLPALPAAGQTGGSYVARQALQGIAPMQAPSVGVEAKAKAAAQELITAAQDVFPEFSKKFRASAKTLIPSAAATAAGKSVGEIGDYSRRIFATNKPIFGEHSEVRRLRSATGSQQGQSAPYVPPPGLGVNIPSLEQEVAGKVRRLFQRLGSSIESIRIPSFGGFGGGRGGGGGRDAGAGGGGGRGGGGRSFFDIGGESFGQAGDLKFFNNELKKFGNLGDASTHRVRALGASLKNLQDILDPLGVDFNEVNEAITKQSRLIDRELQKRERRMSRRRMSPMQITQAAGAAISGGIFGGPEGFLGGVGGALVGGVGGAFAGAAFGAQVGGIRRTLGEYTEYAAQIARLKIALEGIAGSQNQYNRALAAAADVTKSLNVPQDVAIQGITRLTAAVKGAGGGVADAELAFKNINSAIIATGGGAEQVQGAVTALVQIFSKGKVSAEEINQIAERLPGTFNKIAAASGRTGPELTKALQDGKVGLNDLMKFLVSLGDEYGELAGKIAGSSENAGARLRVAFDQMRVEVGNALQPIGAEFQDIFTEFIEDITPTLVAVLPKIGELALALAKNIDVLAGAIIALGAAMIGINFASFIKGIAAIKTVATGAKFAALLVNPWVALAAGIGAAVVALSRYKREAINVANAVKIGDEGSRIAAFKTLSDTSAQISLLTKERQELKDQGKMRNIRAIDRELKKLRSDRDALKAALDRTQPAVKTDLSDITVFDGLETEDDESDSGKGKTTKLRQSRLGAIQAAEQLLGIEKQILDNARQIGVAQAGSNFERVNQLNNQKISLEFAKRAAENQFELNEALARAAGDKNEAALKAEAFAKKEISDKLLLIQYESALADEAQRRALAEEERNKAMSDQLFTLREQLGLVTDDERIARFRQEQEKQFGKDDPRVAEATDLFRQTVAPTFAEGLGQKTRELKGELKELVNPINQITFAANTIGTAFTQSFSEVITGSKSIKEALSDAFASIGKAFLDMATQIIAKQLVLITLGLIQKALGVGAAAASTTTPTTPPVPKDGSAFQGIGTSTLDSLGGAGPISDPKGLFTPPTLMASANGSYFDGQTARFAKGGIVSAPTPFKFSDGGTIKNGLMGEVGPEAILPLERGADGKLGVKASIPFVAGASSVNNNFQQLQSVQLPFTRTSERIETERQERERISAMQDPGSIDVRYESTVINNTEYVTAEQHRRGMAQAAEQGRALTLVALQNSVKTRRKVGL